MGKDKTIALNREEAERSIKKISELVGNVDKHVTAFRVVVARAYTADNLDTYKRYAAEVTGYKKAVDAIIVNIGEIKGGLKKYAEQFKEFDDK